MSKVKTENKTKPHQVLSDYVISCIDSDNYEGELYYTQCATDAEKAQFLVGVFNAEYGWAIPRLGRRGAIKEWLGGLPTSCSVHFSYANIIKFGYDSGLLKPAYHASKEKQEDQFCNSWFSNCATKLDKFLIRNGY